MSVTLGSSVVSLGREAFVGCPLEYLKAKNDSLTLDYDVCNPFSDYLYKNHLVIDWWPEGSGAIMPLIFIYQIPSRALGGHTFELNSDGKLVSDESYF